MVAKTVSGTLVGCKFLPVDVEVYIGSSRTQKISIVGLPDTCVKEARDRVLSALARVGCQIPGEIVINLSPADVKKEGSELDLAICVAVMKGVGKLTVEKQSNRLYLGEVGLDGTVKRSVKLLETVVAAYLEGFREFVLPHCLEDDLTQLPIDIKVEFLNSLADLFQPTIQKTLKGRLTRGVQRPPITDLNTISTKTRKAMLISLTGGHSLFFIGPPGQGKTYTANLLASFLPALSDGQVLENYVYYSMAGEPVDSILRGEPPFRAPHHSVTKAALLGGGVKGRPGEVTLANNGILFLDELGEFSRSTLNALRVPIETGFIVLSRANYSYKLPARFLLVCASNPCPCGFFGSRQKACRCSYTEVKKYLSKFYGPFLERIDLQLFLDDSFNHVNDSDSLVDKFVRINDYRRIHVERFGSLAAHLESKTVFKLAKQKGWFEHLRTAELSIRSLVKVVKIALTHAILFDRTWPEQEDFDQAVQFRKLDKLLQVC